VLDAVGLDRVAVGTELRELVALLGVDEAVAADEEGDRALYLWNSARSENQASMAVSSNDRARPGIASVPWAKSA
jgi:hypothetical protein